MSEQLPKPDSGLPPVHAQKTLRDMMGSESFKEYIAKIRHGLKQPKDSGEYKYAIHQVVRVWSPIASVALPILLVLAVMLAPEQKHEAASTFEITMMDNDAVEKLDDIEEIEPPKPPDEFEPPPLEEFTPEDIQKMNPDDIVSGAAGPSVGAAAGPSTTGASEFSPQPAAFDSVAMIKSPIKMTGIFGSRTPGARGSALAQYGGGGGAGGAATEHAVYLALRWLKKYQEPDGSWSTGSGGGENQHDGARPAMTALGLLTFLAHGETPASEEFGQTVERAIKWLVAAQDPSTGHFKGSDNYDYCMPIATYALCEAFAITRIPMVKAAAEKAALAIVKGQNPSGMLWNYNFDPKAELKANSNAADRNDLSYAGWCMQALKAAGMAGLEVEGLEEAKRKAVQGTKIMGVANADGSRAFGYGRTGGEAYGPWEITGAGVLCLQLLGAGKSKEAQDGLLWLKRATCEWANPWMLDQDKDGKPSGNPIYHWYYVTQAKFHAGGAYWTDWNKQFSPQLVKNQIIVQNAIQDDKGQLVDIGYWKSASPTEFCQSHVYNTTLCALMLQVYYRYLPTYKAPEDVEEGDTTLSNESKDVDIEIL